MSNEKAAAAFALRKERPMVTHDRWVEDEAKARERLTEIQQYVEQHASPAGEARMREAGKDFDLKCSTCRERFVLAQLAASEAKRTAAEEKWRATQGSLVEQNRVLDEWRPDGYPPKEARGNSAAIARWIVESLDRELTDRAEAAERQLTAVRALADTARNLQAWDTSAYSFGYQEAMHVIAGNLDEALGAPPPVALGDRLREHERELVERYRNDLRSGALVSIMDRLAPRPDGGHSSAGDVDRLSHEDRAQVEHVRLYLTKWWVPEAKRLLAILDEHCPRVAPEGETK